MATGRAIVDSNPIDVDVPITTLPGATKPILEQIADAFVAYPSTEVERARDRRSDVPGGVFNSNEEASFRVKVTNRGALTMENVTLKAVAKNGALVKSGGAAEVFRSEAVSANGIEKLGGHGGVDDSSARFVVKAPAGTKPDGTVLVEVTVEEWQGRWTHIEESHSRPSAAPLLTFASAVVGL